MLKKLWPMLLFIFAYIGSAQTLVTVPGNHVPWKVSGTINTAYAVPGMSGRDTMFFPVTAGNAIRIVYQSSVWCVGNYVGCPATDANGQLSTDGNATGFSGQYVSGHVNIGELIGGWVDDTGQLVAPPFGIGNDSGVITAPAGATQISMGENDSTFWDDNGGQVRVIISDAHDPHFVHLQGDIEYHTGTPFNGKIQISLSRASALNTCTGPPSIVRKSTINVSVINGVVTTPDGVGFVPTYCLIPAVPYYVQIFDDKNALVEEANWYVSGDASGDLDVGELVLSNFGGPIVVSVPQPVIWNPPGDQVITQPTGTWLKVNNLMVTGLASGITASAFTVPPSICSAGFFATGIHASGDAYCAAISSGVTNFNGRVGAVVPQAGDYTWSMIGGTPVFYNQLYNNLVSQPQKSNIDFSPAFVLGTETSPNANTVDLAPIGTAGTYANPTSISVDPKGRVTSVASGGGGANPCGAFLGTSCTLLPGGLMMEWGNSSAVGGTTSFTPAFPTTCLYVGVTTNSGTDRISYITSYSNTGFSFNNNGSGATGLWIAVGK